MIRLILFLAKKYTPMRTFLEKMLVRFVQENDNIIMSKKSAKQILAARASDEIKNLVAYEKNGLKLGYTPPRVAKKERAR